MRFGVPYTEFDRVIFGTVYERNEMKLGGLLPQRYRNFVTNSAIERRVARYAGLEPGHP